MYTFAPSSDHKVVHPPPLSHRPSKRAYREISSGRVILIGHRFLITSYKRAKENKNKHTPVWLNTDLPTPPPLTSIFFVFVFFEPRGVEVSWPGDASSRLSLSIGSVCILTVRSRNIGCYVEILNIRAPSPLCISHTHNTDLFKHP